MSVTPLPGTPPAPVRPGPGSSSGGTGSPAAAGFAALVAQLVAGHGAAAAVPPTGPVAAPEAPVEGSDEPHDEVGGPEDAEDAGDAPTGSAGVLCILPPLRDQATAPGGPGGATTTGPGRLGPDPQPAGQTPGAGVPATDGATVDAGMPPTPAPPTAAATATDQSAGVPSGPAAATASDQAPGTPVLAGGSPPVGQPAPSGDARATAPAPVVGQLAPEITRMVTRGDGTHRLTMTLQPEALGEVRVTLTVRNGEVHVRLAAGHDAQRALAEGAPELHRVLELAGAHETRVVVRDLTPGSSSPGHQPTAASTGGSGHGDAAAPGDGRDDTPHQHAGTRGGTPARDGASDGAAPPRPEPVRPTRSAGVDVTM